MNKGDIRFYKYDRFDIKIADFKETISNYTKSSKRNNINDTSAVKFKKIEISKTYLHFIFSGSIPSLYQYF